MQVSNSDREPLTKTLVQLLRFLVVGGLNTLVGYSLFAVLTYAGLAYPAAIGLATVGGVLFNFQSVGRLVFDGAPRSSFWRFVGVYCVIYLLNLGGVRLLLGLDANIYIANALTLLPLSVIAFILNRRFVFNLP
ncbi:GtrA family protein [Burkholderia sp. Bp9142]|nr:MULTISPECIES: GtrA family protein [unclassified Burkholderia]RQR37809.1 GtrA family protein [Burkholderia sp. Bp9142]RQR43566.1 GtrA family protein [Burkholderia sp. Bp9140]